MGVGLLALPRLSLVMPASLSASSSRCGKLGASPGATRWPRHANRPMHARGRDASDTGSVADAALTGTMVARILVRATICRSEHCSRLGRVPAGGRSRLFCDVKKCHPQNFRHRKSGIAPNPTAILSRCNNTDPATGCSITSSAHASSAGGAINPAPSRSSY